MSGGSADPTIVASLGGWGDSMLPLLRELVPASEVVVTPADAAAAGAEILVTFGIDRAELDRTITDRTRWIHLLSTGIEWFPLEVVGDRVLTCSRGANAPAIAEFVLATMLAFVKHIPDVWITEPPPRWNIADLQSLSGATVGLVGIGAIGLEVARRAQAFDMEVLAFRRRSSPAPDPGIEVVPTLAELMVRSDHVVIAAPATPDTHHLIDATALAAVKPGAHLVNIARGSIVDQDALLDALDDGRVAMASLDVVTPEPLPAGHRLYAHPRVRLSAHVSWSAPDSGRRTIELFGANVHRYRKGEPLTGVVDVDAGY